MLCSAGRSRSPPASPQPHSSSGREEEAASAPPAGSSAPAPRPLLARGAVSRAGPGRAGRGTDSYAVPPPGDAAPGGTGAGLGSPRGGQRGWGTRQWVWGTRTRGWEARQRRWVSPEGRRQKAAARGTVSGGVADSPPDLTGGCGWRIGKSSSGAFQGCKNRSLESRLPAAVPALHRRAVRRAGAGASRLLSSPPRPALPSSQEIY